MKTTEIILDGNEYKEIYLFDQDEEDETNNRQQVFINETGRFINYSHEHHTPAEINFGWSNWRLTCLKKRTPQ